ncbi:MAG: TrkH family potassium uptake protein [Bacteroides sp.]|nr:TrkH family potassium uptake protein [Bacteroides sp.]
MVPFFKHKSYINFRVLLRVIGWLLMIEGGFMALPTLLGFIDGDNSAVPFIIGTGITFTAAFSLMSLKTRSREMGKREAILLTSLTWIILSLFGMLPFLFTHSHLSVTDAFFETISGFTTTGMSVIGSLDGVPRSILLWRCLLQWIGGMGIILFTLAVIPMLNYQGGMMLFNAEVTGITHDKLAPRVSYTAKSLWLIYIILTLLLIIALLFSEMTTFDAICYGLSTMSTGGFSTSDLSITEWDNLYVKIVMAIFMFIGGINFSLIYQGTRGRFDTFRNNTVFKVYLSWIGIAYLLFCFNVWRTGSGHDWIDYSIDPIFQAISLASSTGMTEPDFSDWGSISTVVMIVLIFTGACAGSTSGGAKLDRIIILLKFMRNQFYQMMHPSAVTTVRINGQGTSYVLVQKVLGFLFLYILVIMVGGTLLTIMGLSLTDSFFYALSAISNAGLGTEVACVTQHYSTIPDVAKWLLALLMLIGRLELYTVLLLFTPMFWRK